MIKDLTTIMSNILTYEGDKREVLREWGSSIVDSCVKEFDEAFDYEGITLDMIDNIKKQIK